MKEDRETIISFRNADIVNGETTVIYGLDMDVQKGDFVYIIGKVGSGKTSIIRTVIAENPLYRGQGTACGYDLGTIREKDIPYLRRKMGVVFQDFQLLMDRSVEDNLSFVLKATGWKDGRQISDRIREVLEACGIKDGMTLSFHHHFREGDKIVNMVMKEVHDMGLKDIRLCASSLGKAHEALVPEQGRLIHGPR